MDDIFLPVDISYLAISPFEGSPHNFDLIFLSDGHGAYLWVKCVNINKTLENKSSKTSA